MSQGRKEGYKYAPYIPIKEFCYTIPDVEFVGYDKDGKAKFKKIKPKQNKDEKKG
jgi:hypothetical protein